MGRSKQTQKSGDGKHRKETKEERSLRLKGQEEAREACFKLVPYALGVLVLCLIAFSLYVRSVPPVQPKLFTVNANNQNAKATASASVGLQDEVPDFLKVNPEAAAAGGAAPAKPATEEAAAEPPKENGASPDL